MQVGFIGDSKLPIGVNVSVDVCLSLYVICMQYLRKPLAVILIETKNFICPAYSQMGF